MSNETALATRQSQDLAQRQETALVFTDEMKQATRAMVGSLIKTEAQFGLFFAFCANTGLNPVAKEVYGWTDYRDQNKLVIAVGIDGFRKLGGQRANVEAIETAYCGDDGVWCDAWPKSKGTPAGCRCRIWLHGARRPIESVIYFEDFHMKSNPNWNEQTGRVRHMMAVRAEAHAWRKVPNTGLNGYNVQLAEDDDLPTIDENYADALPAGEPAEIVYDTPAQQPQAPPVEHANTTPPRMQPQSPQAKPPTPEEEFRTVTQSILARYQELGGETLFPHMRDTVAPDAPAAKDVPLNSRKKFLELMNQHNCLPGTAGWPLPARVEDDLFSGEA